MPSISIIIPVYNSERSIAYCLDSILQQTYKDYEIILIDDGSNDHSLEVLNKYQEQYGSEIINVISQSNSGASAARNLGISTSRGQYITFVDSDDYISSDYLEILYEHMQDCDVSVCGYKKVDEDFKVLFQKKPMNKFWSIFKYSATWGKLYRKSVIVENNIKFDNFRIGEDLLFLSKVIAATKSIKILSYCGYHYMFNKNSITNTISSAKKINEMSSLLNHIIHVFENERDEYRKNVYYFLMKTSTYNILSQRKIMSIQQMMTEYKTNTDIISKYYKIGFSWQSGEEFIINVIVNLFILSEKIKCLNVLLWLIKRI